MSKGGGGGGTTQTIQKADPWIGLQGPLSTLYGQAEAAYNAPGPSYYPGATVAEQSPVTQQAQDLAYQRATSGNPLVGQAQQQLYDTLGDKYYGMNPATSPLAYIGSGAMLNSNPYLDAMFGQAAGRAGEQFSKYTMPGIASMFSQGGRYGSGAMGEATNQAQQNFGNTISNLATNIYGGNYANERGLQQQALGQLGTDFGRERALQLSTLGLAPGLSQADYVDISQLGQLGSSQDAYRQSLLNADISRWDYGQNLTAQKLQQLSALLQGGGAYAGANSTTTAPGTSNPLMGALGGGMMGYQLGGMLGGTGASAASMLGAGAAAEVGGAAAGAATGSSLGPWGALAGAVLGGLFS